MVVTFVNEGEVTPPIDENPNRFVIFGPEKSLPELFVTLKAFNNAAVLGLLKPFTSLNWKEFKVYWPAGWVAEVIVEDAAKVPSCTVPFTRSQGPRFMYVLPPAKLKPALLFLM